MTESTEAAIVEQTLRDWYHAIQVKDFQTAADRLTEEFLIVENTELLDKQQLLAHFDKAGELGSQSAELTEFKTRIHADIAWTTLHNHEVWHPADGGEPKDVKFIETVVLMKRDGSWLIDRYHATRLDPVS